MNKLQEQVTVSKVTLNIGAGRDQGRLEKGTKLIKTLTGIDPVKTKTTKRIPGWGLRAGLPIGCKLTLRKAPAVDILKRLLYARDNKLKASNFDNRGNFSFGVKEYVDIQDAQYDPQLGMLGLELAVTLEKPGYRVKKRQVKDTTVGRHQVLTKEAGMDFVKTQFGVTIE